MREISRNRYMRELRAAMLWRYRGREIAAVLEDVSAVFAEGQKRGRSEREIAGELGTPGEFVLALTREGGPFSGSGIFVKKAAALLLLCAVIVYLVMLENNLTGTSDAHRNNLVFCAAACVVPALIYFLAGAESLYRVRAQENRFRGSFVFCPAVSAFLAGYEQFVLTWACRSGGAPVLESYKVIHVITVAWIM